MQSPFWDSTHSLIKSNYPLIKSKSKLYTYNIWWHKIYIIIPKEKKGGIGRKYWTKEDWKLEGQISNLVVLCWMSKGLNGSLDLLILPALLKIHFSHGLILLLVCNSPQQTPMALASSISWSLQPKSSFTFTVSWDGLLGIYPETPLPPHFASVAFLSLGGIFYIPSTPISFLTLKPAPNHETDAAKLSACLG